MHPLDEAYAKASRAKFHLDELEREIVTFLNPNIYTITQDDTGQYYSQLVIKRIVDLPSNWGLIVGDFAHNLRSALDYIAWGFNNFAGKAAVRETQCCFPICDKRSFYRDARRNFPNKPIGVRKLIENFQPYHRRHHPKLELLSVIREMDDTDKHRMITPVLNRGQLKLVNPVLDTDTSSPNPFTSIFDFDDSGYAVITTDKSQSELGGNPTFAAEIIFIITDRITGVVYRVEQSWLHEVYELVNTVIIPSFAPFFIRRKRGWATKRVRHLSPFASQ